MRKTEIPQRATLAEMRSTVDMKPVAVDRSFPTDFQGLLTKPKTGGETAGQTEWPLLPWPVLSLILSTQRCSSNVFQTTSDAAAVVPPFLHPGRWEQGEGDSPVWTSLCSSSS